MAQGLVGKKVGMTQVFDQFGNLVAVTVLEVGPNRVIQVKRRDGKDGYSAVKVGFETIAEKKLNRPELGVFHHSKVTPARVLREFRVRDADLDGVEVGGELTVAMFRPGQKLDVCGKTKGRGFQGVMKRHGFKGAKEIGHGTHEYKRHSGSIGQSAFPSRVIKGKRMGGQMGNARVTNRGMHVVAVYPEQNLLLVKGAVPGAKNGIVEVTPSIGRK